MFIRNDNVTLLVTEDMPTDKPRKQFIGSRKGVAGINKYEYPAKSMSKNTHTGKQLIGSRKAVAGINKYEYPAKSMSKNTK